VARLFFFDVALRLFYRLGMISGVRKYPAFDAGANLDIRFLKAVMPECLRRASIFA
jgi:hypothetical protein